MDFVDPLKGLIVPPPSGGEFVDPLKGQQEKPKDYSNEIELAQTIGKGVVNSASDVLDMTLGWYPTAAHVMEIGAASVGSYIAQRELGEAAPGFIPGMAKAVKAGTEYINEKYAEDKYVSGSLSPIRAIRSSRGATEEEMASPVFSFGKGISKTIEEKAQTIEKDTGIEGTKELTGLLSEAFMVTLPDTIKAASKGIEALKGYKKAVNDFTVVNKLQTVKKAGIPEDVSAKLILEKAAKDGLDTSSITQEQVINAIKEKTGTPAIERRHINFPVAEEQRSATWTPMKHAEYKAAADVLGELNKVIAAQDPATVGHEGRVAASAVEIAKRMGLPTETQVRAAVSGSAHDVSKIFLQDIINKQGILTSDDLARMHTHPDVAAKILTNLGIPDDIVRIVKESHTQGTPEFTTQILQMADISDSLIGGPKSGHSYPLRFHDGLKTQELPRTAANVLKVMDDAAAKGQLNPEIYSTYRKMFVAGKIPHAQKVQLESMGEVPWKLKVHEAQTPSSYYIKGFTKDDVLNSLPTGLRKATEQMVERGNRMERGGIVIDTFANNKVAYAQRLAKQTGRTPKEELDIVEGMLPPEQTQHIYGYYDEGTGTIYLATDRVHKPEYVASQILHEVTHMANDDKLNTEIGKRLFTGPDKDSEYLPFFNKFENPQQVPKEQLHADFYSRVRQRISASGSEQIPQEYPAYFVEEAMRMGNQAGFSYMDKIDSKFWNWASSALPQDAVQILKQWIANVRAAMYKHGIMINESDLTVDDIVALAKSNMKALAEGKQTAVGEPYSRVYKGIFKPEKSDLKEGEVGTILGTHFSSMERESLLGEKYGTGIKGAEAERLSLSEDPRIKSRVSFYVNEGQGVFREQGLGKFRHDVPLTNLYDAATNPLKIPAEDFNKFESKVLDKGFSGYYVKGGFGRQGVAVLLGDAAKEIKVPKVSPSLDDFKPSNIHSILDKDNWAILTAENPHAKTLEPLENHARMNELKSTLDRHGFRYTETMGYYGGTQENGVLIRGISQTEALGLAGAFEQESVLTNKGLLRLDGTMNKATGISQRQEILKDNYTHIPETGTTFAVKIDFSKLELIPEETTTPKFKQMFKQRGATMLGGRGEVPDELLTPGELYFRKLDRGELFKKAIPFKGSTPIDISKLKKQGGQVDQSLLISTGFVLGGATLGAYLSPNETTQGLITGAAAGFAVTMLPKAAKALTFNWKQAAKLTATGIGYAGVGALSDKENPIEGILVGSAIFGLRFLPKSKLHPEDELINARNGNIAAEKRLMMQVTNAMKQAVPDKATREQLAVLAENPEFVGRSANEKLVVNAWRSISKSYRDAAVNANVKIGFVEGYVSHIIEREGLPQSEVQKVLTELFGVKQQSVGGKARFTKERMYPTFESLEKALEGTSLKLKTKDIAEITQIYAETMTRTIENQKLINGLKADDFGSISTEYLPGYVHLSNPQLMPYYVNPEVAPALKFVFDARSHTEAMNGLIALNRATKRMNVIGSFFHAKSLLEAYALAGGSLVSTPKTIKSALRLFQQGGLGDEIDLGMRAGLRIEPPVEISQQALAQVGQLADFYVSKLIGKPVHGTEKVLGAVESVQEKVFDKFTWDFLHTGLKTATYLRLMEDYKLGLKGKGIPEDVYRQGVASHVNDTFGGLDWYRVVSEAKTEAGRKLLMSGLKPSSRDILGIGIFAPDWTASTVRAVSKALPGGAKNPANAQLAKMYVLRTAVLYGTAITAFNYILSGHFPWENKDPTRIELPDKTSLQVVKHSMEFVEWVREPFKTFSNKMGFIPRTFEALRTGQQYPKGPPIGSKVGYVAQQVAPFTARSFQGYSEPERSAAKALLGMFGISVYGMTTEEKQAAREQRRKERLAKAGFVDPLRK